MLLVLWGKVNQVTPVRDASTGEVSAGEARS